jgi:hypothetical protein
LHADGDGPPAANVSGRAGRRRPKSAGQSSYSLVKERIVSAREPGRKTRSAGGSRWRVRGAIMSGGRTCGSCTYAISGPPRSTEGFAPWCCTRRSQLRPRK